MKSTGTRYACRTCGRYIVGRVLKDQGETVFPYPHLDVHRPCGGANRPVIRRSDYPILWNFWRAYKVLGVEILEGERRGLEGVSVRRYSVQGLGQTLGAVIGEEAARIRQRKAEVAA